MSEATHTPGPWVASHRSDGSGISYVSADTGHIEVAVSYSRNPLDAPLIAAAPDLLQELKNIANANTKDWDDPTDFKAWAQNRARRAIAKAEVQP